MRLPVRLALRSNLVLALSNGGNPPFPTLAGFACFDTRMDPIEHLLEQSVMPVIVVYAGDDDLTLRDEAAGRGAYKRTMTLIVEIMVGNYQTKDGSTQAFQTAETDPEIEAMLDLLEWQVWSVVTSGNGPYDLAFQGMIQRLSGWNSIPHRGADQANRFAMRQIEITVQVAQDCGPGLATGPIPMAVDTNDVLGIPYLSEFSHMLSTDDNFAGLKADLLGMPRPVPTLSSITIGLVDIDARVGTTSPPINVNIKGQL